MSELAPAERRALRARAHSLRPFISIGEAGLTPAVIREIDGCLRSHELIKVRVLSGDRDQRASMIDEICRALAAHPVQHIGRILVIFRSRPLEPDMQPPAAAEPRSKRSPRRMQGARPSARSAAGARWRPPRVKRT